jgi:hypothetical protein
MSGEVLNMLDREILGKWPMRNDFSGLEIIIMKLTHFRYRPIKLKN